MTKFIYSIPTLSLMGLLTFLTPATAQSVTGSATVSGNITINTTGVFFNVSGSNTPANPLTPGSPNSGSFAGLTNGAIKNLAGITAPGPLAIKSFATFNTPNGTIVFDLQSVAPGTGTSGACSSAAIGTICTPTGSPLTLIQVASNAVAIVVTVNGIAYPATPGPGSTGTAVSITIQEAMAGIIPNVLPTIATPSGIRGPCSATLNVSH